MVDDLDPELQRLRAQNRLGIIDALIRAIDIGWPLLEAIESSVDRQEARQLLGDSPFGFTEIEVEHILDLPLSRRTQQGRSNLEEEATALRALLRGDAGL